MKTAIQMVVYAAVIVTAVLVINDHIQVVNIPFFHTTFAVVH